MRRALALLVPLVVFAAGCGSATTTGGTPTSVAAIAASARRTAAQGTAHAAFTVEGKQGSTTVKGTGEGSFDFAHHSGLLSLEMKSGDQTVRMDEVMAMPVIYMRSAAFGLPQLDNGDPMWLKVDLQAEGKKLGIDFSSLMNASPDDTLSALGRYGANVVSLGDEDVRGIPTTHYRATLDMAEAAAKETGATGQALQKIALLMNETKVPVDVWIDSSGLTRRYSESFSENVPGSSDSIDLSMTYDLYDYGTPVTITVPDPKQVLDAAKLRRG